MNLLLVALLLATQAPGAQDTVPQVLLRLEDDWAEAAPAVRYPARQEPA